MKLLKYLSRNYFALIKLHQNLLDFSNRLTNNKCSSQTQSQTGPATYFTGAWHLSYKDELSAKYLFQYILGLEGPSDPEVLGNLLMGKSIAVRGEQNPTIYHGGAMVMSRLFMPQSFMSQ